MNIFLEITTFDRILNRGILIHNINWIELELESTNFFYKEVYFNLKNNVQISLFKN